MINVEQLEKADKVVRQAIIDAIYRSDCLLQLAELSHILLIYLGLKKMMDTPSTFMQGIEELRNLERDSGIPTSDILNALMYGNMHAKEILGDML
jgi:hypothetical protein